MKENAEELHARQALESHSFDVERIAVEPGVRRADFRVKSGVEETILEVTDKKETQFLRDLLAKVVAHGLATSDREVDYWNGIDRVIKDKADQLRQTPGPPNAFRVLWLSAMHTDGKFVIEVAKRTAYGLQDLLVFPPNDQPYSVPCFYYQRNSLYAVPELDGIVLVNRTGGQLCVNGFSPRATDFRASAFAEIFPHKAILDPTTMEQEGRAFILDGSVDRTDQKAKWRAIYDKYGARTTAFTMNQFRGFVSIPKDLLE